MRPKKRPTLKDEHAVVFREKRASNSKKLDDAVTELENRLLGKDASSSIKTISGDRPESKPVKVLNFVALHGSFAYNLTHKLQHPTFEGHPRPKPSRPPGKVISRIAGLDLQSARTLLDFLPKRTGLTSPLS
jgi:hypothetical protein